MSYMKEVSPETFKKLNKFYNILTPKGWEWEISHAHDGGGGKWIKGLVMYQAHAGAHRHLAVANLTYCKGLLAVGIVGNSDYNGKFYIDLSIEPFPKEVQFYDEETKTITREELDSKWAELLEVLAKIEAES